ncbi:asparaginase [Mycolicibacterium sp.]|uniref:asparaginase n=1 Tax=Mycolicibacterium sp. TaxID=2320850 RepID=UPI0037C912DB
MRDDPGLRRQLAIGSAGGTISMTPGLDGGLDATLTAQDMVTAIPELADSNYVSVTTLSVKPGASVHAEDVMRYLRWADQAVGDGADGVVLTHGTDTLEETAYLLDLYWDKPQPLVVTGAMRAPGARGADGPGNVSAASRVALSASARDLGVLVVMNDEIHAARRVSKLHTNSLAAFGSPNGGPLGRLDEGAVRLFQRPTRRPSLPAGPQDWTVPVLLTEAVLGDDGAWLDLLPEDFSGGLIVSAFGVGHVSAAMAPKLIAAAARIPVVLSSRTGAGTVHRRTYGFPGSERDLLDHNLISAGYLSPVKARLLLWAALAGGSDTQFVSRLFREHGTP